MAELSTKIKIYLESKNKTYESERHNFYLIDNGSGPVIGKWTVSGVTEPTESELNALESQAESEDASTLIIYNRKKEYPSIEECVHAILDDDLAALQEKRQAIKTKYPKG